MCRLSNGLKAAYEVAYADVGEVHAWNTDRDFLRYAAATAATRAEARNWRKALSLKGIAAEEITRLPAAAASPDGLIAPHQVYHLNFMCARLDVDLLKFVASAKGAYDAVEKVPAAVAERMAEALSEWQRDQSKIPERVKGYDKDWRSR